MEYSQSLAGNPPLLGESLYVPKNLIELTPNEYAERSMTKISVLSQNMETPQRFDDVIRDQQKNCWTRSRPPDGTPNCCAKPWHRSVRVELGCWKQVVAPAITCHCFVT
jgi:hypothetical protein